MTHFFTSDWHLCDANIIGHENLPFGDVDAMAETQIRNTRRVMSDNDSLWILGDFIKWAKIDVAREVLRQIPGREHLIHGNHDRRPITTLPEWALSTPLHELNIDKQPLTLCHYPMADWNGAGAAYEGAPPSIQLFGHVHGKTRRWWRCVNVSVEVWDYTPASLEEVVQRSEDNYIAVPFHLATFPDRAAKSMTEQLMGVGCRIAGV